MTAPDSGAGRSCAGCTMCCKLLDIPELQKPALRWCTHCDIGTGCKIYETRPAPCAAFACAYLTSPALDARWYPADCKLVVAFDEAANRIYVHAENDAWRKEPYYTTIKSWARQMWKAGGQVLVWQGHDIIAALPQKDVNLGRLKEGQRVHTRETFTATGVEYDAVVM